MKKNFLINFLTVYPHILGIVQSGLVSRNRVCSYFWPEISCSTDILEKLKENAISMVIRINMARTILASNANYLICSLKVGFHKINCPNIEEIPF